MAEHARTAGTAERYVVKYNCWMMVIATGILAAGIAALTGLLRLTNGTGMIVVPLTNVENGLFILSAVGLIAIGAAWFVKGLCGSRALVMTDHHIRGFTLLGSKTIRWEDIARVEIANHDTYGKQILIHAARGTPSSSIWLNCIPLYVALTDKTVGQVHDAIRAFRPDV